MVVTLIYNLIRVGKVRMYLDHRVWAGQRYSDLASMKVLHTDLLIPSAVRFNRRLPFTALDLVLTQGQRMVYH